MTDKIPEDFSAIDPAKVREMEVRDDPECQWVPRSVIMIKNGGACATDGQWWEHCREIPVKKMQPWTRRQIMDFCRENWPEVFVCEEWRLFWDVRASLLPCAPYRLADGTTGKFEVEE